MRTVFWYGIRALRGSLDHLVNMAYFKGRVPVARKWIMPTLTEHNTTFGEIGSNLAAIWDNCSADFKADLEEYAKQRINYYDADMGEIPAYSNYAHFVRFIYAFKAENPTIDFTEVTKGVLELEGCPNTVADIVLEGFLPPIPDTSELTKTW